MKCILLLILLYLSSTHPMLEPKHTHSHHGHHHHDKNFIIVNIDEGTDKQPSDEALAKIEHEKCISKMKIAAISGISAVCAASVTAAVTLIIHFTKC